MPVTDALMGLGSFTLTLKPETPPEVRAVYEPVPGGYPGHALDTLVVTPGRVLPDGFTRFDTPADLQSVLFDNSIFTGRIDYPTRAGLGEPIPISGPSILAWLGDANGKGNPIAGSPGPVSTTLLNRLGQVFGGTPALDAGFDLQIHWTAASTGVTVKDDVDLRASQRSNLDRLRVLGGSAGGTPLQVEYYAAPDGKLHTFDYGNYAWFRGDSTFVLGPGLIHEERDGLNILPANVKVVEDWSDFAMSVYEMDSATNGSNALNAAGGNWTGDPAKSSTIAVWDPIIDGTLTVGELANRAAARAVNDFNAKYRYTVSLTADDTLEFVSNVSAGSRVYVYDPLRGQTDAAQRLMVNGHEIGCARVRISSQTWPLVPGMGVYAVTATDFTLKVADLSTHIDYSREPKQLTLNVGSRARTLTGIVRGI